MSAGVTTALVAGHVTRDRVGDRFVAGGGAFYGARAMAALGVATRLVTAAADEAVSREGLRGVIVERQQSVSTTTFANQYQQDGSRTQWVEDVAPRLHAAPSAGVIVDILFMTPVFGEINPAEWTASVQARLVGLGLQGLLRRAGPGRGGLTEARPVIAAPLALENSALAGIDIVFLSEEDVAEPDRTVLVERLRIAVPMVAVTQGDRGSTLYLPDRTVQIGTAPAAAVDPTGAGDTYAATFLVGLARGLAPESAGRLAAAAASIVVEGMGGTALAGLSVAEQRMESVTATQIS